MTINDLQSIMRAHQIRPELIVHLLEQGIEIERLNCQVHEALDLPNQEEMLRLLQGERFLMILSSYRFA